MKIEKGLAKKKETGVSRAELLAAMGGIVSVPPPPMIADPETVKTLEEAFAEKQLVFKRSADRYRGKKPKKGHIWYYIHYQLDDRLIYTGAYEMPLAFESYLLSKGEDRIEKFLFSALAKELSNDDVVTEELDLKAYNQSLKLLNQ